MTTQNKKMYYLFSIAAEYECITSLVVLFHCLCGTWFSSVESRQQNYVYIHTYTIHFHQREKEKHVFVLLLNSSNFIK